MSDMAKHSAAGTPLRRARTCAWIVTVVMGATTMAFQVYHSVKFGRMPWELAGLYGVVPLLIAVLVLEIVAEWRGAPWPAQAGAYLIMGAAMFLSASATGSVVLSAAPAHFSLLPGALLDGAELLAAYFIMNGPTAAQAVAEVARREAELTAAATAAREELDRAVAEHRKSLAEAEAAHRAATAGAQEWHRAATARAADENTAGQRKLSDELDRLRAELGTVRREAEDRQAEAMRVHRMTVDTVQKRADDARAEAEAATRKAEALARKLAAATGSGKSGSGTRKPAVITAPERPEAPAVNRDDLPGNWDALDTEARVLFLVNEKGYSASKAGLAADVTDARGRQIVRMARDLGATAPQDVVGETPES